MMFQRNAHMAYRLCLLLPEHISACRAYAMPSSSSARLWGLGRTVNYTRTATAGVSSSANTLRFSTGCGSSVTADAADRRPSRMTWRAPNRWSAATSQRCYATGIRGKHELDGLEEDAKEGVEMCPQGIQGEDNATFRCWMTLCQHYGKSDCNQQLEGIQTGRVTLYQMLKEQEELIHEIASNYKERMAAMKMGASSSQQGLQGTGIYPASSYGVPCPQGVQGEDCARYQLWMENCQKFGFGNCMERLQGLQEGQRTLGQVFAEQEAIIEDIARQYQQKRSYHSQAGTKRH